MNNDIIKMFIGGEEVVSNKEFAINEEMLSASSTILNNCYPASWETNKDYASNFYYPKDYSKFILGKGNFTYGTDQYYILTVSGNTFMQFTTNVEKELAGFTVYGKSTQKTRSGKNLLKFSSNRKPGYSISTGGLTFTINNDYSITVNGTNDGSNSYIYIMTGETLSLPAGTFIGGLYNNDFQLIGYDGTKDYYLWNVNTLPSEVNFTDIYIQIDYNSKGKTFNNVILKPIIVSGESLSTYEPYGVMPSPDYPSEIESVGYENLFDKDNTTTQVGYFRSNGAINSGGGSTITTSYTPILPNTNMIISGITLEWICFYDENKAFIKRVAGSSSTFNENAYYIRIQASTSNFNIDKIQLEKGTQIHSYIPYGKYGIEVKNTGKNLFDGIYQNAIVGGDGVYNTNNSTRTAIIKIKPNTNYSIKKFTNTGAGTRFIIVESSTLLASGQAGTVKYNSNSGIQYSYTSGANANYLYVYVTNDTSNIPYLMVIESNIIPTTYEEYKSNSTLFVLDQPPRSLPNGVKDIAYIKNNILYVDRKVGSVVLNGSENWIKSSSYNGNYYFYSSTLENKRKVGTYYITNYFESVDKIANFKKGTCFTGDSAFNFWLGDSTTYTTLNDFKSWLSTHNTQVDYELAEPYTEEVGKVDIPYSYEGINNTTFDTGIDTEETIYYYWKNYDVLFAGIVKNSGDISLRPTDPKYCSLQILDYKTFLSESDTLDFVISDKTIAEAISMVVDAISGYGFILGTININQADDVIGAYSTLNKTAYDVFQYLANISGSRWRARFVDSDTMAIDFYDPELLPRANDIDYTQQYWEDNKIVDLTFNYGTRDYRNKQIILSDEVYGGIDYTEVLLSNGYGTSYITQNNIANITSITVNGVKAEVITQSEKDLGVDADFYYTPGKNVVESTTSYSAGTQIIITYTPLVKGRQIVYNDEEVTRIATQTNTTGVISRYENRNDILSSDELENIAETYIKYKGKPEIILKLTTLNNDLFSIGEICYFNSPIADLAQDYMVKSKTTNYTSVAGETNIFYTYELTSSFNSEKAINYFDNQRNKTTGNIAEGESITRNIDINNSAMIIWENATITEISVSVDGDNALNSVLNSPFIQ